MHSYRLRTVNGDDRPRAADSRKTLGETLAQMAAGEHPAMATSTWCVLVVRAWRDRDGLKIRLLCNSEAGHVTAVETSIQAACERVASFLAPVDEPDAGGERIQAGDGTVTGPDTGAPYGRPTAPDG
jgi:hypothetical protein